MSGILSNIFSKKIKSFESFNWKRRSSYSWSNSKKNESRDQFQVNTINHPWSSSPWWSTSWNLKDDCCECIKSRSEAFRVIPSHHTPKSLTQHNTTQHDTNILFISHKSIFILHNLGGGGEIGRIVLERMVPNTLVTRSNHSPVSRVWIWISG